MGKLAGLNALRGLAALTIMIFHVWGIHKLTLGPLNAFVPVYLGLGVPLFFVISGFSLFLSTRPRVGREGWIADYACRRFMRIAPLFYALVLFYIGFNIYYGSPVPWRFVFGTLSMLFNLMPGSQQSFVWAGWTIGVEMLFYLMLPYLLMGISGQRSAALITLLATGVSIVFYQFYTAQNYPEDYARTGFLSNIGVFLYGILGYFLYNALKDRPVARSSGLWLLALAVVLAAALYRWEFDPLPFLENRSLRWSPVFALLVVSQCLRPVSLLSNRPLAFLGRLSFGLYLWHPPLVYKMKGLYDYIDGTGLPPDQAFALCAVATLAILIPIAGLANVLIETPGVQAGEWWIRRREHARAGRSLVAHHPPLAAREA